MKFWQVVLVSLTLTAAAQAHHIWIVPQSPTGPKAKVTFGDTLDDASPATLAKVAHTKLWVRDQSGKDSPLTWRQGPGGFMLDVPGDGPRTVGGSCVYGVETHDHRLRREVNPYLLIYHPKMTLGKESPPKSWHRLPLEILPVFDKDGLRMEVLFKGKRIADAEMIMFVPGATGREELVPDDKGNIVVPVIKSGVYGFRTRHIEPTPGEHAGKKYDEIRHYASLVMFIDK